MPWPHLELRLALAGHHQLALRHRLRLLQRRQLLLQLAPLLDPLLLLAGRSSQALLRLSGRLLRIAQLLAHAGRCRGCLGILLLCFGRQLAAVAQRSLGQGQPLLQRRPPLLRLLLRLLGCRGLLLGGSQLGLQPAPLLVQLRLGRLQCHHLVLSSHQILLGALQRPRLRLAAAVQVCR